MNIEKFSSVSYEKAEDGLVVLTFNNPKKKNSVSGRTVLELWWAADHFEKDETAYAMVITGTENYKDGQVEKNAFCAGADFAPPDFSDLSDEERAPLDPQDIALKKIVMKMNQINKPVIAAMNGYGIGVGFTLPLSCADFIYLADTAYIKLPFVGIGIMPELASTYLLPRIVGVTKANDILYSGRKVFADEVLQLGLCNEVYPQNEVLERSLEHARKLMPPQAAYFSIMQTKRAVRAPLLKELEEALDRENAGLLECMTSSDFREAMVSKMEKREPKFTGK